MLASHCEKGCLEKGKTCMERHSLCHGIRPGHYFDGNLVVDLVGASSIVVFDGRKERLLSLFGSEQPFVNRKDFQKLLGGGAVASLTKLAKDPSNDEENKAKYHASHQNTDTPERQGTPEETQEKAMDFQINQHVEVLDRGSNRWRRGQVIDSREGTSGADVKHILIALGTGSRVWLDLSKDSDRVRQASAPLETRQASESLESHIVPQKKEAEEEEEERFVRVAVEITPGLMVECKRQSGVWEKAIVESIDPVQDSITVSFVSDVDGDSQQEFVLEQGIRCKVRTTRGGAVSLRGIVFTSGEGMDTTSYSTEGWYENFYYNAAGTSTERRRSVTATIDSKWEASYLGRYPESPVNRLKRSRTVKVSGGSSVAHEFTEEWGTSNIQDHVTGRASLVRANTHTMQQTNEWALVDEWRLVRGWKASSCRKLSEKSGGRLGLANLGNTCFMNAVLQALMHCGPLVETFLWSSVGTEKNARHRVATAFLVMLQAQWNHSAHADRVTAFRPRLILELMGNVMPNLLNGGKHDAQEFLVFLLDTMHEELNLVQEKRYKEMKEFPGVSDTELANMWWENYAASNDSLVKDLFVGQICSKVVCRECGYVSTTFDPFWSLSLPLSTKTTASSCSLEDCFALFSSPESLVGEDKYYCSKCQSFMNCTKTLELFKCPRVLVVHLKRFHAENVDGRIQMKKLCTAVSFPADGLDLGPYCSQGALKEDASERLYDLVGVINHHGHTGGHGHYTADCYEPNLNQWYNFDDSFVGETKQIRPEAAYILLYVRQTR